ncbi:hypothetical protein EI42_02274 [Thermosporothrix hazakensis]|uniref:Uncharacterized protein n=1 Tax=Thermosporothrix hazakensis TaxID=644383 RepID=A0A326U9H1_THEHA|nr:hypothetical protein [Thermosporothrix hazakensis]PZW31177.1 hypothetical protein EI42_02274 [Thermosporothrix hazakensis]GCE50912.1 hypothetical protein KTH_57810 [Thermosporothrix hazakensis]
MELRDTLRVCLQAILSRCPHCMIEADKELLGRDAFEPRLLPVKDVIRWYEQEDPSILEEMACLRVDAQRCEIALCDRCLEPVFRIYKRDKAACQS